MGYTEDEKRTKVEELQQDGDDEKIKAGIAVKRVRQPVTLISLWLQS